MQISGEVSINGPHSLILSGSITKIESMDILESGSSGDQSCEDFEGLDVVAVLDVSAE